MATKPNNNYSRVNIPGWPGGMNNRARETALPETDLRYIQNADPLPGGKYARRKGYTAVSGANGGHSPFSHPALSYGLYVDTSGNLVRVDSAAVRTTLTTVNANIRMSYCYHNGKVYFSNGAEWGKVDAAGAYSLWGTDTPPAPIVASNANGGLLAGRYQVAYSWIASDGEESPVSPPTVISLTSTGGITVSPIPSVASGVSHIRIYTSSLQAPDGQELFLLIELPNGTSSYSITRTATKSPAPDRNTQRIEPLSRLVSFKRRILGAKGKFLKFTEHQVSLMKKQHNWLPFDETITAIMPVDDGVFVGTSAATYWCAGNDAEDFTKIVADGVGVLNSYSAPHLPSDAFPFEGVPPQGRLAAWVTTAGEIVIGRNGGFIQRITTNRLAIEKHRRAAFHPWTHDGRRLLIATLYDPIGAQTRKAPDTVI